MRTIKSFETFVGESNTFDNTHEINFGQMSEAEVLPGVELNPPSYTTPAKLKNNFYVVMKPGYVQFVGLHKDDPKKIVALTIQNKPFFISEPGWEGEYVAYVTVKNTTPKEGEKAEKAVKEYSVAADGKDGKLSNPNVATNLLGGFLAISGTNLSPASFQNLVKAIVKMGYANGFSDAKNNGGFKAFRAGLMTAAAERNAFKGLKGGIDRLLNLNSKQFSEAWNNAEKEFDPKRKV